MPRSTRTTAPIVHNPQPLAAAASARLIGVMPSTSSPRTSFRPVVVEERRPDNARREVSSPSSPRVVSFNLTTESSRQLAEDEAQTMSQYEKHAKNCDQCKAAVKAFEVRKLCKRGAPLAQKVEAIAEYLNGDYYSIHSGSRVRLELPSRYLHSKGYLQAFSRGEGEHSSTQRPKPIVHQDIRSINSYTTSNSSASSTRANSRSPKVVFVEPARSTPRHNAHVLISNHERLRSAGYVLDSAGYPPSHKDTTFGYPVEIREIGSGHYLDRRHDRRHTVYYY